MGGLFCFTQVLSHPWLEAERVNDPAPVNTEEEALLMTIPRPRGPPLQLRLQKHEYPYIRSVVEPVPHKPFKPAVSEYHACYFVFTFCLYCSDPGATVLASTYRHGAMVGLDSQTPQRSPQPPAQHTEHPVYVRLRASQRVSLGDVTTFGGVLSRLGISSGERMLQNLPPFQPTDACVCLDNCVPRRCRGSFFKHLHLALLDR